MLHFTELDVWKEARLLVKLVYEDVRLFSKEELFGIQSQIKRCVNSIPSNVAEGCGRNHRKDSSQLFYIARGPAYELETQLYLSFDLGFLPEEKLNLLLDKPQRVRILLSGLINRYKSLIDIKPSTDL